MKETRNERDKLIVKYRKEGKTFQEIADIFNVSRQRVHQIYKKLTNHQ